MTPIPFAEQQVGNLCSVSLSVVLAESLFLSGSICSVQKYLIVLVQLHISHKLFEF